MPVKFHKTVATFLMLAASLDTSQAQCADSFAGYMEPGEVTGAYREFFDVTGGAIAILRGGEVVYSETFGFANVEFGVPVKPDTRFQLSSSTKLFTGTLMAMLSRDGVIDYSRPVRHYLSDLPEAWSDVSIEDVMSHLSGLPEVLECNENDDPDAALRCVYTLERPALRREKFSYNQTNYLLAMRVIETASGTSFSELLSQRIFEPAGMSSAVLNGDSRDVVHRRATGYYPDGNGGIRIRAYDFPEFLLSAAGMNASLDDMIAFAVSINGDKLLDERWKARMWRAPVLNNGDESHYTLGWDLRELRGAAVSVGHEGGSLNTFRIYPESGLSVIVLTNGMHKRFGLDGFADVLAQSVEPGILAPLDSAAYRARLAYMKSGLDAMSVLIRDHLCKSELDDRDCREMLTWLAEELEEDGYSEDSAKLVRQFGPEYGL